MARILYIDDQVAARTLVESVLKSAGHEVTLSADGHDGVEKMIARPFDLLITDAIMPGGVSGYDVIKTLRRKFDPGQLPVIVLTGRSERRDVERMIEAGITGYVLKPLEPASFLVKVNAALAARLEKRPASEATVPGAELLGLDQKFNVTALTERGLTLRAFQALGLGQDIAVGEEFFEKVGVARPPRLVVAACAPLPAGQFEIEAEFRELDEAGVAALRTWISFNRPRPRA